MLLVVSVEMNKSINISCFTLSILASNSEPNEHKDVVHVVMMCATHERKCIDLEIYERLKDRAKM